MLRSLAGSFSLTLAMNRLFLKVLVFPHDEPLGDEVLFNSMKLIGSPLGVIYGEYYTMSP